MMINKRLIETVSESKRYIAGNVLMQQIQDNVVLSFIDSHNLLQPLADRMNAKIF